MSHAPGHQASRGKSPSGRGKPGDACVDGIQCGRLRLCPVTRLAGLSAHRQVYVAQDICLDLQIFQSLLDDIPNADDANKLAAVNHQ